MDQGMDSKDSGSTQGWVLKQVTIFTLSGVLANALVVPTWFMSGVFSIPLNILASVFLALRTMRHPLLSTRVKYLSFAWSLVGALTSVYAFHRSVVEPGEGFVEALVVTLVWQIFTLWLLRWIYIELRMDGTEQEKRLDRLIAGIFAVLVLALLAAPIYYWLDLVDLVP